MQSRGHSAARTPQPRACAAGATAPARFRQGVGAPAFQFSGHDHHRDRAISRTVALVNEVSAGAHCGRHTGPGGGQARSCQQSGLIPLQDFGGSPCGPWVIRMARKSFTLVSVGPVTTRSPNAEKKL